MPVLIDGHNLIAHMPDLRLDDPDDEVKLVLRLRAYNAHTRKKVTVVFDHGLPGGWSRELSTGPVNVIFAGTHTNADRILIERIRADKNPHNLTVVSSDSEVRSAAAARGARTLSADQFAAQLAVPPPPREITADIHLTPAEVEEWLQIFGKKKARQSKTD